MTAAMGVGAVVGGLYTASRPVGSTLRLTLAALFFGFAVLLTAVTPTLPLALAALLVVGFCSVQFTALGNTTLQLESAAEMRGRVMALWTMAFLGSTLIGGPLIGWIGDQYGSRWALALGGFAALAAAGFGARALQHHARSSSPAKAIGTRVSQLS
jgi:MFS family permease